MTAGVYSAKRAIFLHFFSSAAQKNDQTVQNFTHRAYRHHFFFMIAFDAPRRARGRDTATFSPKRRWRVERRTRTGGTADQNGWNGGPRGWNGGPERVERRTSTGGTADQNGWNGGPARREGVSAFFLRSCAPPRKRINFRA